jgi:hypothetical protein
VSVADTGTEESQLQKKKKKKLTLQSAKKKLTAYKQPLKAAERET